MDRDIEQAADAATPPDPVFQAVREAITAKVGLFDLDGAKHPTIDELTRAVIAVAVRATAERIAAGMYEAGMIRAAEFVSDFYNLGLSADAATGEDGDE